MNPTSRESATTKDDLPRKSTASAKSKIVDLLYSLDNAREDSIVAIKMSELRNVPRKE